MREKIENFNQLNMNELILFNSFSTILATLISKTNDFTNKDHQQNLWFYFRKLKLFLSC
jgi:hypothetical protein